MNEGLLIAIIGAAAAAVFGGLGSALGVQMAGKAATGVVSEKPELFGKVLILQALPGTQGIYGFLVAILVLVRLGLLVVALPCCRRKQAGPCLALAFHRLSCCHYRHTTKRRWR